MLRVASHPNRSLGSSARVRNAVGAHQWITALRPAGSLPPGECITRVSVVGRNVFDPLRYQITGRRMADVAQTEDADHPLALVDHRQSADLQPFHVLHRLGE